MNGVMGLGLIANGLWVGPLWAKEIKGKIRREKKDELGFGLQGLG